MDERLRILELIESGQISVEEGLRRLEALDEAAEEVSEVPTAPAELAAPFARPAWIRIVWQAVFWSGIGLLTGGGLLLANAYGRETAPGLTWGWVLFALGVLVVALGWWLGRARWFYLRVREESGRAFALALPLPLGLVPWLLRAVRPFVPQLREAGVEEMIMATREELRDGCPFVIDVDEGENGERVKLYIC